MPKDNHEGPAGKAVSRREFLKIAGIAGAGVTLAGGLGGLLAACGGEEETTTTTAGATTTTAGATTTTAGNTTTTAGVSSTLAPGPKTLKLGCVMPFSGAYGFYGVEIKPYVQHYVDIINESGGYPIGDYAWKIEVLFPDDGGDPKQAPRCIQELVDFGAVANFGCFTQGAAFLAGLTAKRMMHVGQMNSGIDLKTSPWFIGGACEWGGGPVGAAAAIKAWPSEKYGFICYDWQKIQHEKIKQVCLSGNDGLITDTPFYRKEVEVLDPEIVTTGNQDFAGMITKLYKAGCKTVMNNLGPGDAALCAKQAFSLGYTDMMMHGAGMVNLPEFIAIAGTDGAQLVGCSGAVPWLFKENPPDQDVQDIAKEIFARREKELNLPWDRQYNNVMDWGVNHLRELLEFYRQAGTFEDPDAVMEKVVGGTVSEFTGVTTMGGTRAWGDTARIKPSNGLLMQVVGDHLEYVAESHMPVEW